MNIYYTSNQEQQFEERVYAAGASTLQFETALDTIFIDKVDNSFYEMDEDLQQALK